MLRAIDIQHVLIQSNATERVQQSQQQHPDQQQRYLDVQAREEKKLSKETVKNTEDTENARVQEKEDHEKSKHHAEHQAKDNHETEPKDPPKDPEDDEHGGIIDIRV